MSISSSIPLPEHEGELNYVSKYLIQHISVKTKKVSVAGKWASGARVFTSDECVQILAEQGEKKQKELEEKAKRKKLKENKRKKKERKLLGKRQKKERSNQKESRREGKSTIKKIQTIDTIKTF